MHEHTALKEEEIILKACSQCKLVLGVWLKCRRKKVEMYVSEEDSLVIIEYPWVVLDHGYRWAAELNSYKLNGDCWQRF